MFFLFSALFSLASSATQTITVCYPNCPSSAEGTQIIYDSSMDLSSEIQKYISDSTNIFFYSSQKYFTFPINIAIFDGITVQLEQHQNSQTIDIDLDVSDHNSTAYLLAQDIGITLSSKSQVDYFRISSLTLYDVDLSLNRVGKTLICGSLTTDNSVSAFSNVQLDGTVFPITALLLDFSDGSTSSVTVRDRGFDTIIGLDKISYQFLNTGSMIAKFANPGTGTVLVSFDGDSSAECPSIEFNDFQTIRFSGSFPSTAIFTVSDRSISDASIYAEGSVLPVSITGDSVVTIYLSQTSVTINGDIESQVVFAKSTSGTDRIKVTVNGAYSVTNRLDLGTSYLDLVLNSMIFGSASFGSTYPFLFRVGLGGASTITANQVDILRSSIPGIVVYPDFTDYQSDESLKALLDNTWDLLTLKNIAVSVTRINLVLQKSPFVHGFVDRDSCMTVFVESNIYKLNTSAPSAHPLSICFDGNRDAGECREEDGVEILDINQVPDYFQTGMKYLNLSLKTYSLSTLDFSTLVSSYTDVKIVVRGITTTKIDKISFPSNADLRELELVNLKLGDGVFYSSNITFSNVDCESYSQFTFYNNKHLVVDDLFMQKFIPCIDASHPINRLTYKMDYYDSITFAQNEYIFYDLATNDISEPFHVPYDILSFLDLVYDVSMTSTAAHNNINLTMQTASPSSFNLTFEFNSGYYIPSEIILYNWSVITSDQFYVYVEHGSLPISIVLTEPYDVTQIIIPIGDGKVTYINRYSDEYDICCATSENQGSCPEGSNPITPQALSTAIASASQNNITVYLIKTTGDSIPAVKLGDVNNKVVTFIGETAASDEIAINPTGTVNVKTTTTIFKKLNVRSTGSGTYKFGELDFISCTIDDSFKSSDIEVDDFTCDYVELSQFKSVRITDQCTVTGDISTVESTVNFNEDENTQDLIAEIGEDCTIVLGNSNIKIGMTTFQFNSPEAVYDVVLRVSNGKTVNVDKATGANEDLMPIVLVEKAAGTTFNFDGDWKEHTRTHVFMFYDFAGLTLNLYSESVPISFSGDSGDFSIIANAETVGISGNIQYRDITQSSTITVKYASSLTKAVINIEYLTLGHGILFQYYQPNLEVVLANVAGSERAVKAVIESRHYSSTDGDSLLTISEPMTNAMISPTYHIQLPIQADIEDSSVVNFYSKNHTLIKVYPSDAASCTVSAVELYGTIPTTHGFTESNIWMNIDQESGEISLYFKTSPSLIPFNLCYETTSSCEIRLTESTISNVGSLLPSGKVTLNIRFGKSNTNPLALDTLKTKGSTVVITQTGTSTINANLKLGSGYVSLLSVTSVQCTITDSSSSVDSLELVNNGMVDNLNIFGNLNMDITTFNNNDFTSYNNNLVLNITQPLEFTSNGWNVASTSILASKYPKMQFNYESSIPTLEVSKGVTKVYPTTIISHNSKSVTVGSNWESVTETSSSGKTIEFISSNLADITVTAKSFPFVVIPELMSAGTVQIDADSLPYTVTSAVTFNNIQTTINFLRSYQGKGYLNFDSSLTFEGTSSLGATNSYDSDYPITIKSLEVNSKSNSNLTESKISSHLGVNFDSVIGGNFNLDTNSEIILKWKLNAMPFIRFDQNPTASLPDITLVFEDSNFKNLHDEYETYLYHKTFSLIQIDYSHCSSVLNRIYLNSSVSAFGSTPVFEFSCDSEGLKLYGRDHIPIPDDDDDDDDDNKSGLSSGAIAAIVIVVILVVAGLAVGGYFFYKKRRLFYYSQFDSAKLDSKSNEAKYIDNQIV